MAISTNKRLGLPYQGSKSRIARQIVDLLPPALCLVDAFAGGCAVTHAALESGKFDKVIANDLSDAPELFYRVAKSGGVKPLWVSREEFFALKDTDPLIRYAFSFGNNGGDYMYGRDIEPLKHAAHLAVVDGDCSRLPDDLRGEIQQALDGVVGVRERYLAYKSAVRRLGKRVDLQNLQSLERLTIFRRDYRDLYLPPGSVVYCDPPYAGTRDYGVSFDHRAFYSWCRAVGRRRPLFVSEYWMPSDFRCVAEFE